MEEVVPRTCIAIVCIGQKYLKDFEETFKPSIVAYAQKYGYDVRVFDNYLGKRHPDCISFEKCLVPSQLMEYDCVVLMDADIYITKYAPPIHTLLSNKIGMIDEACQISPELYKNFFGYTPIEYYKRMGFDIQTGKQLNGGLIVCSPKLHSDFLKNIYEKYIEKAPNHPLHFHYEQTCLGYEIQSQNMYDLLGTEWNRIYAFDIYQKNMFPSCNFLHFAGLKKDSRKYLDRYLAAHGSKSLIGRGI